MSKVRLLGDPGRVLTDELFRFARAGDRVALEELARRAASSEELRLKLRTLVKRRSSDGPLSAKQLEAAKQKKPSQWTKMAARRNRGWVPIASGGLPSLGKKR
jgi:hypothetical protein